MSRRLFNSIVAGAIAVIVAPVVPSSGPNANLVRADDGKGGKDSTRPSDGDRQRLEETGPAIVKEFGAALRKRYSDERAGELRKFIDPRYLKEHSLQDGAFPMRRVVTGTIYDNQLSDDPRTALIIVKTEDAAKECLLFRLTVHEGRVYISPLAPPDKKTKTFNPWILRVKL